jgi:hypothetical protein
MPDETVTFRSASVCAAVGFENFRLHAAAVAHGVSVLAGPGTDGRGILRAASRDGLQLGAPGLGLARLRDEWLQGVPELLCVLGGKIDFEIVAVEGETHRFIRSPAFKVINENYFYFLRHGGLLYIELSEIPKVSPNQFDYCLIRQYRATRGNGFVDSADAQAGSGCVRRRS